MSDLLARIMAEPMNDANDEPAVNTRLAFEIKKFVLQALLEKAITVVPTRDVMPVLKCFQFVVDTRLRVIASDTIMSLVASTPMVVVRQPGTAVFPAKKLLDIVKTAEDADVAITVTGTAASITIGRASWTLKLQGGDDYPVMPTIDEAAFTAVNTTTFKDAITHVRYAASRDPNRANLNIISITDGKLTACDGSRFQQTTITDFPANLILPISAVDDLLRLLKITDIETIQVGQSNNHLIFRFGSDIFIVNKFRAQFPDMEAQMLRPALENKHELNVERNELVDAIKRVRINADPESSAITLRLTCNEITVSAQDKFDNTATQTIDGYWNGTERSIVVNHRYLLDLIRTHGDITCIFKLGDDTKTRRSPLLLTDKETGGTGVVQQMAIDWIST